MEKPDRIWLVDAVGGGEFYTEEERIGALGTAYIRSTPEREHAEYWAAEAKRLQRAIEYLKSKIHCHAAGDISYVNDREWENFTSMTNITGAPDLTETISPCEEEISDA